MALDRPSYQCSTFVFFGDSYGPDKGNDGDKINCDGFSFSHSVAQTYPQLNPWYAVDLGVPLKVAGVKLINRADLNGKRGLELLLPCVPASHDMSVCLSVCQSVSLRVCLSVLAEIEKLLIRNWCKLVRICVMVNSKSN